MDVAMRSSISFVFALLWWVAGAVPPARAAGEQACNVNVDIIDTDPKGTNVRASPGGNVTATLKNAGDGWIGVHVIGQQGAWYEIDRASRIGADEPPGGTPIFNGQGWLHKSVLGVNGMQNGGAIYAAFERQPPTAIHQRVVLGKQSSVYSTAFMFDQMVNENHIPKNKCAALVYATRDELQTGEIHQAMELMRQCGEVVNLSDGQIARDHLLALTT